MSTGRRGRLLWLIFSCLAAEFLNTRSGLAAGLMTLFAGYLLPSCLGQWVLEDAKSRHRGLPYDFGTFVFFGWPVVIPIYLFSTRGWRAFGTMGNFLLLSVGAWSFSLLPILLHFMRR